ncbi:hypothetical protein F4781DRAFT_439125 [Annulohypoxylon bovei var. microspora]|nr:hypothetical protein F4781DRAFT_439125 [Annulohypoxylon bovei var. microspora]
MATQKETPKRQKWLDVYDSETGNYIPNLLTDDQSPVAKSPGQGSDHTVKNDTEQPQTNEHASSPMSESDQDYVDSNVMPTGKPGEHPSSTHEEQGSTQLRHNVYRISPACQGSATLVDTPELNWEERLAAQAAHVPSHVDKRLDGQESVADGNSQATAPEEDWNLTWCDREEQPYYNGSYGSDEFIPQQSSCPVAYIKDWIQTTHEVVADILPSGVEEPELCDVNPETGVLMKPIEHPVELGVEDNVPGAEESTEDRIGRANRRADRVAQLQAALKILERDQDNTELRKRGVPIRPSYPAKETVNPREIRIPIHLRPAQAADLAQIVAIYNMEVKASPAMQDKYPVELKDFLQIYYGARKNGLPFFVAVEGWYSPQTDSDNERVVGFALMDMVKRGITGSYATHADVAGKLTIVVHPDYRRLNICSAMLDAIFYCCSPIYTPRLGYQIVNPTSDRRHMRPKHNVRQWNSIDIEVNVSSGVCKEHTRIDPRYEWISNYLEKYFQMSLVSHDEALYRIKGAWLDRLIFRHACRPLRS